MNAIAGKNSVSHSTLQVLPRWIFASRWLQLPLYIGLIVAQLIYVWKFWVVLIELIQDMLLNSQAISETAIMLTVLGLIDVVMISNLLVMVTVGGYETFVSRMPLDDHPDRPEWLSHVNASVLKVKLATAIIAISSIHLLKTFIEAPQTDEITMIYQTIIHIAFLFSALAIAYTDVLLNRAVKTTEENT